MNVKVTGNEVRPPQGGGASGIARRESSEGLVAGKLAAPIANEGSTVEIGATICSILPRAVMPPTSSIWPKSNGCAQPSPMAAIESMVKKSPTSYCASSFYLGA